MTIPLVSIIIPVFNSEKYLVETINSVLAQTWPNKEIIIVDDGSSDQSVSIAGKFNDKAVKIIQQQNNGASAARNKGLFEAKGKYIQFLDADDLLSPDKISEQVMILENNPGKVAVCSTIHFKDQQDPSDYNPSPYEESFLISTDPIHFLINLHGGYSGKGSMVSIHSWLTPRYIIDKAGQWNEELSVGDDGEFFCRVILNSTGTIKTNGFSYYRKFDLAESLSALKDRRSFISHIKAVDLIREKLNEYLNPVELYNCFYKRYKEYGIKCFPANKDLSKYSLNNANAILRFSKIKADVKLEIGGPAINFIANNISWKLARYLQYLVRDAFSKKMWRF